MSNQDGVEIKIEMIDMEEEGKMMDMTSEKEGPQSNTEPPDGGYGWIVAIASCFAVFFSVGNVFLFSVFLPVYVDEFHAPQGATAWVGSISGGLMTALGIFVGAFSDYYGNQRLVFIGAILLFVGFLLASYSTELWHLYMTHGIINGVGMSCVFISIIGVTGPWFTTKRALALGIAFCGSGLGQLGLIFIANALINRYGWRACLRYLGIIEGGGIAICSCFIRRFPPLKTHLALNASWGMLTDARFLTIYFAVAVNALGLFVPLIILIIYAKQHGVSNNNAVMISALGGVGSTLGRILSGHVADRMGSCLLTFKFSMFFASIATFCMLACTDFVSILFYTLIYSALAGAVLSLLPALCAEIFGVESLGSIMGLLMSAQSVGNFFSAPIGGSLYDLSRTYTYTIITAGGLLLCGSIILFFIPGTDPWEGYDTMYYTAISGKTSDPPATMETSEEDRTTNRDKDVEKEAKSYSALTRPSTADFSCQTDSL